MADRTKITLGDITVLGEQEGDSLVVGPVGNVVASGISGGGPGASDFTLWSPDAKPASPSIYDDEFDDSSVDTGLWTEFDVPVTQTVVESEFGLYFVTSSTSAIQGIYQDVPAGAGWTVYTHTSWLHEQADDQKAGILLLEDVNNLSTSDCIYFGLFRGGAGQGWQIEYFTDYQTHSSTHLNEVHTHYPPGCYMRVRAIGTSWYFDYSWDGLHWIQRWSGTRDFTPEGFGISQRVSNTSTKAIFKFFRYSTNTDVSDVMYGDRIDGWRA